MFSFTQKKKKIKLLCIERLQRAWGGIVHSHLNYSTLRLNKYFHFHNIFITHTLDTCACALMTVGRCLSYKALPDSAQYNVGADFTHFKI